jgi:hypothetical protein
LNCESCAVTGRRGRETGPTHPSNWSVCPPASCTLSQVQVSALDQSRSESTVDVMVQHDRTERRSPGPGLGNLGGNYRHDGAILGEQGRCWAEWGRYGTGSGWFLVRGSIRGFARCWCWRGKRGAGRFAWRHVRAVQPAKLPFVKISTTLFHQTSLYSLPWASRICDTEFWMSPCKHSEAN